MIADPDYTLSCDCGKTIEVAESAAGSRIPCACGRQVQVPSLRELRQQQGVADQTNPVLQIEYRLAAKELPAETTCTKCGESTDGVLIVHTLCERSWRTGDKEPALLAWLLAHFSPFLALMALARQQDEREYGRHVHLPLPLRLCPRCRAEIRSQWRWPRRRVLKELLRRVPLYQTLLDRYPQATVRDE